MTRASAAGLAASLTMALGLPGAVAAPPEPADPWGHLPQLRLAAPETVGGCEATSFEVEVERRRDGGFAVLQRIDVDGCAGRLAVDWPTAGSFEPTMIVQRGRQAGYVPSVPCGGRLCFGGQLSGATLELRFDLRSTGGGLTLLPEVHGWGSLPEVQLAFDRRHGPTAVVVWQQTDSWQDQLRLESGDSIGVNPRAGDRIGLVYDDRFTPGGGRVRPARLPAGPPDAALAITEDSRVRRFAGQYRRGRRHGPWTWHHEHVPAEREVLFDDGVLLSMGGWTYGAWRGPGDEQIVHEELTDCPDGSVLEGAIEDDRVHQWCRWTADEVEVRGGPWTEWRLSGELKSQRVVVDGELHGVLTEWTGGQLDRHALFERGQPVGQELGFVGGVLRERRVHGARVVGRDAISWYPSGRKQLLRQPVAGMGDARRTLAWYPTGVLQRHCEPVTASEGWCWDYRPDGTLENSGSVGRCEPSGEDEGWDRDCGEPSSRGDLAAPSITARPVVLTDVISVLLEDVPAEVLEASAATRAVGQTGAKPGWVYVTDLDRDGQADWLVRYANAFATVLLGGRPSLVHAGEVLRVVDLHLRIEPGQGMASICGMQGAGPDGVLYFCHDFARGRYDLHGYPEGLQEPRPWTASCGDFGDCQLLVHAGGKVWRSDDEWAMARVHCPGDGPCVPRSGGEPAQASGDLQCSQEGDQLACVLTHEVHLHLQRGWRVDLSTGEITELELPTRQGATGSLVRVVGAPRWVGGVIELTIDEAGELRRERMGGDRGR
jgi:hypothetical protein